MLFLFMSLKISKVCHNCVCAILPTYWPLLSAGTLCEIYVIAFVKDVSRV